MATLYIDETPLEISEQALLKLLQTIQGITGHLYDEVLPPAMVTAADMLARKKLYDLEQTELAKGASVEEARRFRPGKKESHAKRFIEVMLANAAQGMDYAELRLTTSHGQVTDFAYQLKDTGEAR